MVPKYLKNILEYDLLKEYVVDEQSKTISGILLSIATIATTILYAVYTFYNGYYSSTSTTFLSYFNMNDTYTPNITCNVPCLVTVQSASNIQSESPYAASNILDSYSIGSTVYPIGFLSDDVTYGDHRIYVHPKNIDCKEYTVGRYDYSEVEPKLKLDTFVIDKCKVVDQNLIIRSPHFSNGILDGTYSVNRIIKKRNNITFESDQIYTLVKNIVGTMSFMRYNSFMYFRGPGISMYLNETKQYDYPKRIGIERAMLLFNITINGTVFEDLDDYDTIRNIFDKYNSDLRMDLHSETWDNMLAMKYPNAIYIDFEPMYTTTIYEYPTIFETFLNTIGKTGGAYGAILLLAGILKKVVQNLLFVQRRNKNKHITTDANQNNNLSNPTVLIKTSSQHNITEAVKRSASGYV